MTFLCLCVYIMSAFLLLLFLYNWWRPLGRNVLFPNKIISCYYKLCLNLITTICLYCRTSSRRSSEKGTTSTRGTSNIPKSVYAIHFNFQRRTASLQGTKCRIDHKVHVLYSAVPLSEITNLLKKHNFLKLSLSQFPNETCLFSLSFVPSQ